jgi:hypothetical protein
VPTSFVASVPDARRDGPEFRAGPGILAWVTVRARNELRPGYKSFTSGWVPSLTLEPVGVTASACSSRNGERFRLSQ